METCNFHDDDDDEDDEPIISIQQETWKLRSNEQVTSKNILVEKPMVKKPTKHWLLKSYHMLLDTERQ